MSDLGQRLWAVSLGSELVRECASKCLFAIGYSEHRYAQGRESADLLTKVFLRSEPIKKQPLEPARLQWLLMARRENWPGRSVQAGIEKSFLAGLACQRDASAGNAIAANSKPIVSLFV